MLRWPHAEADLIRPSQVAVVHGQVVIRTIYCMTSLQAGEHLRKTRLCKFDFQGACPRGDSCNFAHGIHEQQRPSGWQAGSDDVVLESVWAK